MRGRWGCAKRRSGEGRGAAIGPVVTACGRACSGPRNWCAVPPFARKRRVAFRFLFGLQGKQGGAASGEEREGEGRGGAAEQREGEERKELSCGARKQRVGRAREAGGGRDEGGDRRRGKSRRGNRSGGGGGGGGGGATCSSGGTKLKLTNWANGLRARAHVTRRQRKRYGAEQRLSTHHIFQLRICAVQKVLRRF